MIFKSHLTYLSVSAKDRQLSVHKQFYKEIHKLLQPQFLF